MPNESTALAARDYAHQALGAPRLIAKLKAIAPRGVNVEHSLGLIEASIVRNTTLATLLQKDEASAASVYLAIARSIQVGLEVDTPLREAYILPFKGKAALVLGYPGAIKLAYRGGYVADIQAFAIHEDDRFEWQRGNVPVHLPPEGMLEGEGPLIGFWAVATMRTGGKVPVVMSKKEVDRIMRNSPGGGESGPWQTHYEEMGKKTAIKRLGKVVPMSSEVSMAFAVFDEQAADPAAGVTVSRVEPERLPDGATDALPAGDPPVSVVDGEPVNQNTSEVGESGTEPLAAPVDDGPPPPDDETDPLFD